MEKIGLGLAFFIVGWIGLTIGLYIASQIKCHIRKNTFNKNFKEYEDGKKKCKK